MRPALNGGSALQRFERGIKRGQNMQRNVRLQEESCLSSR